MSERLFSAHWHRVSALRPRLRAQVQVQRQLHRGEAWYQLADSGTGRRHRLNAAAYRFVGYLDGSRTTGEAWQAVVAEVRDQALTQDDAIRVLGELNAAGLLQCEMTPDIEQLFRQHRQQVRRRRWMALNPLAVRVRLFDPSRFLTAFEPWLKLFFGPLSLCIWLMLVLPALVLAAHHWPELTAFAASRADAPRYWLIAWIAYPLIKALHELGHALAVRRWGGEVQEVGFTLFVLVPAPYVDASAASAFTSRWQRAAVSAMGIMVELAIAAIALYVWLTVQPGWVRDIAFVVMLIAAVSTLLFNGNPLLRFDGYYVLCDALDLPNLDLRSRAWWMNQMQRTLFRVPLPAMPLAAGERKWLIGYAPLALMYRIYIAVLIAFWVGAQSLLLGLVVVLVLVATLIIMPVVSLVRRIRHAAQHRRALRVLWGAAAALLALVTLLPLPYGTVAPGVVWLPEQAEVRAQTDGFLQNLRVRDGDGVAAGQVLALLEAPELQAKQAEAHSRLNALRVQYYNAMQFDRVQAKNFSQALTHAQTAAEHIDARIAQLEIRGQAAGRMVLARQEDLPGRFYKKGETLGYVFAPAEVVVRAIVSDDDAALVRQRARGASVWLEEARDAHGQRLPATVRRDVPAASFKLPSASLAERNGGVVMTDPADAEHLRTLQPIYAVDVALPESTVERIGGRAWVRFDLGSAPLALQWGRALHQLLLKQFARAA